MSAQETHDATPWGHGTGALSPRAPQPPAQGKGKTRFLEAQPRSQGCTAMEKPGEEACGEGSWLASPLALHLAYLPSQEMHPTSKWGGGSHVLSNFSSQVPLRGNIL